MESLVKLESNRGKIFSSGVIFKAKVSLSTGLLKVISIESITLMSSDEIFVEVIENFGAGEGLIKTGMGALGSG